MKTSSPSSSSSSSSPSSSSMAHAVVIVLGDSGRSPRMQFHAQSLADMDEIHRVSLIGYSGEACNEAVSSNEKIRDCRINASVFQCIEFLRNVSSLIHAVMKGILLVITLVRLLFSVAGGYTHDGKVYSGVPISYIIIQNPPATPVLLATYLYRYLVYTYAFCTFSSLSAQSFTICIDWHNLGFTLYYDRYKPTHILVRICYYLEYLMAQLSDTNFCVSAAMRKWLLSHYGIESIVFYDRPPKSVFQKFRTDVSKSTSHDADRGDAEDDSCSCVRLTDRHELLQRLNLTDSALFPSLINFSTASSDTPSSIPSSSSDITEVTIQTFKDSSGVVRLRPDRAVLLLSSTSWTPDEDFTLLTDALLNLDKSIAKRRGSESPHKKQSYSLRSTDHPIQPLVTARTPTRVVVVITGKGPMKEQFMSAWQKSQEEGSPKRLTYISLVTVWLEIADYPLLVGCADMGICLHTSSSGVDLPMKVLDMFGSAVPVCAVSFPALPELVHNGVNGIIFRTSSELAAHLFRLFCDYPRDFNSMQALKEMKKNSLKIGCWEENWAEIVRPVVLRSLEARGGRVLSAKTAVFIQWGVLGLLLAFLFWMWGMA